MKKLTHTESVSNREGIRAQYECATKWAGVRLKRQAAEHGRIPYGTQLMSAVNTGDDTVFEFTAQALRPLHYYYRQWRDHRSKQKRLARRKRGPGRWLYPDGTPAPERFIDCSPWYAHVAQGITGPVHISASSP